MLITLQDPSFVAPVAEKAARLGWQVTRTFPRAAPPLLVVDAPASSASEAAEALAGLAGVDRVVDDDEPFPLAGRRLRPADRRVRIGSVEVGGPALAIIAGPCSVEPGDRTHAVAEGVRRAGARLLRGGAYKPRTSPYPFAGLGELGLTLLSEAGERTSLPIVTEVLEPAAVEEVAGVADCLQVGARNMQNFPLLRAVGEAGRPVLLKRGFGCTVDELLWAAEHVLSAGNDQVILCERGIRTFEREARFTFDLGGLAALKEKTGLPVIADPSHAAGRASLVLPLALGAIAAGADGLLVEVHDAPGEALSDSEQALTLPAFAALMDRLAPVAAAVGRTLDEPTPEEG